MSVNTTIAAPARLLRVADLSPVQLNAVLDLADAMRDGPGWWRSGSPGGAVACLFDEPLADTCALFEVAAHRLGLLPMRLRPDELLRPPGASLDDVARALSRTTAAIVVGASAQTTVATISRAATVPVINAMTDAHHPCQALGDLLTVRRRFGYLEGLRLAYVGRSNNVVHSLMEAGALAGMQVVVAAPRGHEPEHDVSVRAIALANSHGGSIQIGHDPRSAVIDADIVYTSPTHHLADLPAYQVDAGLMRLARPHAVFMHRLPARRGEEVTADVIQGPASVVSDQAANGLPCRQALLHAVVTGTLDG